MLSTKSMLLSCVFAAAATGAAHAQGVVEIEELIVTAEKREQSLQDVPVAVTAFTDERRELLGIRTAQDLVNFTPGIAYNTGNDRLTMRGIGRLTNNRSSEGGVAMYSDGFYTSSVYAFSQSTLFLERTEVLRGPQGTLYGRNAIGGAMNIISKRPTDDFYAEVRASRANYDERGVEALVSGPLFWGIRGRAGGSYLNQGDGFYTNIAGGPSEGGRGKVWFYQFQLEGEITDRFDWWVKFERSETDALGRGAGGRQGVTVGVPNTALSLTAGVTPSSQWANFNRTTPLAGTLCGRCFESDTPNQINIESETIVGQATLHLDGFDVKYIAGRTWYHYELTTDVDATANGTPFRVFPNTPGAPGAPSGAGQIIPTGGTLFYPQLENRYDEEPWWFSNELNFASTHDGPVQWLVGMYQFRESSNYTPVDARVVDDARFEQPRTPFGGLAARNPNRTYAIGTAKTRSESYAGFGQVDWSLNDQVKITAGLRYTYDRKQALEGARLLCFMAASPACPAAVSRIFGVPIDFTQFAVATGTQVDPSVVGPVYTDSNGLRRRLLKQNWEGWGGTLGVDWQPDPDTLLYAKFTRGYKAGGFNSAQTTLPPLVTTEKETINAYEIGAKKTFGGNLQVNASAFYYDYNDIQAVMSTFNDLTQTNTALYANLPGARSLGLELEAIWQPIENLQFNATYAYLDAEVAEACCFQDSDDPQGLQPGVVAGGQVGNIVLQDLDGATLGSSTPHRVSLNANYTWNLEPGDVSASVSYVWRDDTYYSIFNRYYNRGKAFEQVDARVLFNDSDRRFTVIGYVKNLFDVKGQIVVDGTRLTNIGPNFGLVNQNLSYVEPRRYGIEIQYRFN